MEIVVKKAGAHCTFVPASWAKGGDHGKGFTTEPSGIRPTVQDLFQFSSWLICLVQSTGEEVPRSFALGSKDFFSGPDRNRQGGKGPSA
jgi:hypothetical protein